MRKNLTLLGIVILLVAGIYYFQFYESNESTLPSSAKFAVNNTDQIHKIFIADMEGNQVTLIRKKGYWSVNNKYPARRKAMKHLLEAIREVEISAPVAKKARERVVNNLASNNIKVELYDQSESLIKSFYVGGSTNQDQGTYMMLEGAEKPYITHIPGFDGYLTPRFFTDSTEWRSRIVMRYKPFSIRKITLNYPQSPKHSFSLRVYSRDSFEVQPLHQNSPTDKQLNKAGVKKYLTFFKKVGIEGYINEHPKQDSIRSTTPYAVLRVVDRQGHKNEVVAYPKPKSQRTKKQFTKSGQPTKFDPDRMYGVINNGQDFALIQTCPRLCTFGKIFRRYQDFFVSPDNQRRRRSRPN